MRTSAVARLLALAWCAATCSALDLEQRLDALAADSPAVGSAGIHVVDAATGKTLYGKNQERLLLPASNLKILTSALALERLRPDYRFTTRVVREASGNVVLVGSGDPSLSGRAYPYSKDRRGGAPLEAIEQLADAVAARGGELRVRVRRVAGLRQWLLTGAIPVGHAGVAEILPVDDPALFAASAVYDALTRRGIAIRGQAVARHRGIGEPYNAAEGEELASRISPPLLELLQVMDKVSENLHAELILREVGRVTRGEGSTEAGIEELNAYLNAAGGEAGDWRLEDGSGLSLNTLVTLRLLTRILTRMAQSPDRDSWISLLPAGGEDGTLSHRLCCVSEGRGVRAKTGSLSRAQALSGYADSRTYGQLAFSILANDFAAPPGEVRQWIDRIAAALLE